MSIACKPFFSGYIDGNTFVKTSSHIINFIITCYDSDIREHISSRARGKRVFIARLHALKITVVTQSNMLKYMQLEKTVS